jgi:hypothetical protein
MESIINGIKVRSSVKPASPLGFNEWAKKYRVSQAYQPPVYSQAQHMISQNSVREGVGVYTGLSWLDRLLF